MWSRMTGRYEGTKFRSFELKWYRRNNCLTVGYLMAITASTVNNDNETGEQARHKRRSSIQNHHHYHHRHLINGGLGPSLLDKAMGGCQLKHIIMGV